MQTTPVETVNAYRTSDGRIFENEHDATEHQQELDFIAWYDKMGDLDGDLMANGYSVEAGDLLQWLRTHRTEVLAFIGVQATQ
jgi:hypothetical protein